MAKKELVCVSCPIGCSITVELSDSGEVLSVTGTRVNAVMLTREPSAHTPKEW